MQRLAIDARSWQELSKLLDTALDLPPERRDAWLDTLGSEFDALKPRLRELLSRSVGVETGDFLGTLPRIELPAPAVSTPYQAGFEIAGYRLLRELGSGGMGSVWLAERTDGMVNRAVALKLPHGAWIAAGLAERMAREREILASLNHPNIATLYDAGVTSEGQPFLALEYVEGRPIDDYCRDHSLDLRSRLKLFAQVGHAVAHAHAKLVVHRDLKPSNILVTAEGQVRLLDFGIAKLLEVDKIAEGHLTELTGRALTPDYASPEQIQGEPITTASDVYSLGVILYELLTGERPYRLKRDSRGALEDAIVLSDPRRPSDVVAKNMRSALRGDLDVIALKALKKRPDERYATVNALVEDVYRFLDRRPVLARPDSAVYRLRRFLARNRLAASAATLVAVALIAGTAISAWQARLAIAERQYAQEVERFMTSIFSDASPYQQAGKRLSTVEILNLAAARIDRMPADQARLKVKMRTVLGTSLLALGELSAAEALAQRAGQEMTTHATDDEQLRADIELLMVHVDKQRGRTEAMRARLDKLLAQIEAGIDLPPQYEVRALTYRTHAAIDSGAAEAAETDARKALGIAQARLGAEHEDTFEAAIALAQSMQYRSTVGDEAIVAAEQAMSIAQRLFANQPHHPHMISARVTLGNAHGEAGDGDRAIEIIGPAIADARAVYGAKSQAVAFFLENIARYQRRSGDIRGALASAIESFEIQKAVADPKSYNYLGALAARGMAYMAVYDFDAAAADLSHAAVGQAALMGATNGETLAVRRNFASALAGSGQCGSARREIEEVVNASVEDGSTQPAIAALIRARIERRCGNFELAAVQMNATRRKFEAVQSRRPVDDANVALELALNHVESGRVAEARVELDTALKLSPALRAPMSPMRAEASLAGARIDLAQNHVDRALQGFEEVDSFWKDFDDDNRFAGVAAYWLGQGLARAGRSHEAEMAFRRASTILQGSPFPADRELLKKVPRSTARVAAPPRR
jgi:serine/threonine protein kinase/predicted negative regulator of RcsB-dependent stress response